MALLGRFFVENEVATKSVRPTGVVRRKNEVIVDVSGQTCPGYLLAINHAVDPLPSGTRIKLLITYPPCGDDVATWCSAKGVTLDSIEQEGGKWVISLLK